MIGVPLMTLHKLSLSGSAIVFIKCVHWMGSLNNDMVVVTEMLISTQQGGLNRKSSMTDRQTERQTDRQRDRETERQTDRQTDGRAHHRYYT